MPDRGGAWIEYLEDLRARTASAAARFGLAGDDGEESASVRLVGVWGNEEDLLSASLYEASGLPEDEIRQAVGSLDAGTRSRLIGELVGDRRNRRHKPGRGFEALRYRFEVTSDYGAFR